MNAFLETALQSAAQGCSWVLAALALATLLSEDLACIAAGLLVAEGTFGFAPAAGACFAGILGGDLLLVLLGRTIGRRSLDAAPLRWWVSARAVRRAERWFEHRGPSLIVVSRFMPGTRLPTYLAAGVLRAVVEVCWLVRACLRRVDTAARWHRGGFWPGDTRGFRALVATLVFRPAWRVSSSRMITTLAPRSPTSGLSTIGTPITRAGLRAGR